MLEKTYINAGGNAVSGACPELFNPNSLFVTPGLDAMTCCCPNCCAVSASASGILWRDEQTTEGVLKRMGVGTDREHEGQDALCLPPALLMR